MALLLHIRAHRHTHIDVHALTTSLQQAYNASLFPVEQAATRCAFLLCFRGPPPHHRIPGRCFFFFSTLCHDRLLISHPPASRSSQPGYFYCTMALHQFVTQSAHEFNNVKSKIVDQHLRKCICTRTPTILFSQSPPPPHLSFSCTLCRLSSSS